MLILNLKRRNFSDWTRIGILVLTHMRRSLLLHPHQGYPPTLK